MSGLIQVSEGVFYLPSDALEVIQSLINKQFDVIVSVILTKNIILPTPLLLLSDVLVVISKVYNVFALIIPLVDDLQIFLRSYLHSKEGALQEIQQSTTMFMTLKPVVKDYNDYTCFSYNGRVVTDT